MTFHHKRCLRLQKYSFYSIDFQDYKNNFIITINIYNFYLYLQFYLNAEMSNIENIVENNNDGFPPRLDTYYQDEENPLVFISWLCQPSERDENIRMSKNKIFL